MNIFKADCVSCFRMTQAKCGDDYVCFECYVSGRYLEWLKEQGRYSEIVIDDAEQAAEELLGG